MALETSAPEAVANSVFLTLFTRSVQLIGIPVGLWLLYTAGGSLATLTTDVATLKAAFQTRIETAQAREHLQDERIGTLEAALFRHP